MTMMDDSLDRSVIEDEEESSSGSEPVERAIFRRDVWRGLSARPKTLQAKYFYDEEGSRLFDAICELDEYYPTRTEMGILRRYAGEMAARIGEDAVLVEFGAGSTVKIRLLLDALSRVAAFVPIDISGEHLMASCRALADDYPGLPIVPIVADFNHAIELGARIPAGRRVGFFPGSTIGNFEPACAGILLRRMAESLGAKAGLVIGVDLVKPVPVLEAAYDDAKGITARFNLNLLERMNRELDGDFRIDRFRHRAFFNGDESRIEMHLESRVSQTVSIGSRTFRFAAGETIHTENSYKFTVAGFSALAERAGWRTVQIWTDARQLFSVFYLECND